MSLSASLTESHGELLPVTVAQDDDGHGVAWLVRVQRVAEVVQILHRPPSEFDDHVARTRDLRARRDYRRGSPLGEAPVAPPLMSGIEPR